MVVESKAETEVQIVFVDTYTHEVTHIFNANAFAKGVEKEVGACVTRLTIFRHSVREVCAQVSNDFRVFKTNLDEQVEALEDSAIKRPDLKLVCYHDNTLYLSAICSSLIYLKSFLDMYSILICKSIIPTQSAVLFSKKLVDGEEKKIAGGTLINWLNKSTPDPKHAALSEVILRHSKDWINLAVSYRDKLTHYGDLPKLHRMRLPLRPEKPPFSVQEIEPPKMPDDVDVRAYVLDLSNRVHEFLEQTIPLIPGINMKLVDFRRFPIDSNQG